MRAGRIPFILEEENKPAQNNRARSSPPVPLSMRIWGQLGAGIDVG